MRERWLRTFALVIGLLGIPSVILQILQAWPPAGLQIQLLALQAVVMTVFVVYGFGWAYCAPRNKPTEVSLPSDMDL